MNSEFVLREIGGPNDGDTTAFFSLKPFAVRTTGFVRLPSNDTLYLRQGGTTVHPNDFNDWGLDEPVTAITIFGFLPSAVSLISSANASISIRRAS